MRYRRQTKKSNISSVIDELAKSTPIEPARNRLTVTIPRGAYRLGTILFNVGVDHEDAITIRDIDSKAIIDTISARPGNLTDYKIKSNGILIEYDDDLAIRQYGYITNNEFDVIVTDSSTPYVS
jgi:hypothetical protein